MQQNFTEIDRFFRKMLFLIHLSVVIYIAT